MPAFSIRRRTVKAVRVGLTFSVAGISALGVGGCASGNGTYSANSAPAYVAQGPSVPMESDGLPVQAAPAAQIRQMPDDPSQPYSRNYGGTNPASKVPSQPTVKAANDVAPLRPAIPDDLPPSFRRQLVAATDAAG